MADEQVIIDIKVNDADILQASKTVDILDNSIEDLSDTIGTARKQNKEFNATLKSNEKAYKQNKITATEYLKAKNNLNIAIRKNNSEIAKNTIDLQKQKRERKANLNILSKESSEYDKLSTKLNETRRNAKNLAVTFGTSSKEFLKAKKEVTKLDKELKKIDNELGQNQRSVGNYAKAWQGFKGFAVAGITAVGVSIGSLVSRGLQLSKNQKIIEKQFDLTTKSAKDLTLQMSGLSKTYGKEFDEIKQATLTVSKEFGISGKEALKFIEEGFSKGSDNSGEFIDMLKEYPAQFKASGISAGQMFAIINKTVDEGIYSDKGIDAIKEGGLRLRENTKAVQDALKPLDDSIKKQIEQEVQAGNSFKAIQLVSEALNDSSLSAMETQTIIADVFGGAGEDAGLRYLQSLKDIDENMNNVAVQTTGTQTITQKFVAIFDKISLAFGNFINGVANGEGVFGKVFGGLVSLLGVIFDTLAFVGNAVSSFFSLFESAQNTAQKAVRDFNIELAKEQQELNNVFDALKKTEKGSKERAELVKKINKEYPGYIKNINLESAGLQEIEQAQKQANRELERSIALKTKATALEKINTEAIASRMEIVGGVVKYVASQNANLTAQAGKDANKLIDNAIKSGKVGIKEINEFAKKYDLGGLEVGTLKMAVAKTIEIEQNKVKELALINATFSGYTEKEENKRFDLFKKFKDKASEISEQALAETKKGEKELTDAQKNALKKRQNEKDKADKNYLKALSNLSKKTEKINQSLVDDKIEKNKISHKNELQTLENSFANLTETQKEKIKKTTEYKETILSINDKYFKLDLQLRKEFSDKETELQKKKEQEKADILQASNDKMNDIADAKQLKYLENKLKEVEIYGGTEQEKLKIQNEINETFIQQEKDKLTILLENDKLTQEQRDVLTAEHDLKVQEIEIEKELASAEREVATQQRIYDTFAETQRITQEFAGNEIAIFGDISKALIKGFAKGKLSITETFTAIGEVSASIFSAIKSGQDAQLTNLQLNKEKELLAVGDNKELQAQINEKYAKQEADLKLQQWKSDKKSALTQVAINTALSVAKTLATLGVPIGIPASIIAGSLGLVQAGIIASKQPPKFEKGISDIVNIGGSHASGNDVSVYGYDNTGRSQFFGKVEQGEAMPVIRKSAVNEYMVSKLNNQIAPQTARAGVFADGTNDITASQNNTQNIDISEQIATAMQNVTIVTKVEDVTSLQSANNQIVSNSEI